MSIAGGNWYKVYNSQYAHYFIHIGDPRRDIPSLTACDKKNLTPRIYEYAHSAPKGQCPKCKRAMEKEEK